MANQSAEVPRTGPSALGTATTRWSAGPKTALLSIFLVLASVAALAAWIDVSAAPLVADVALSWWAITAIAVGAELVPVHVDLRRESYTFMLSEVPMVLGLFFASPRDLVVGRLLGEFLVLAFKERQHPRKLMLNSASNLATSTTMLLIYRAFGSPATVPRPLTWAIVLVAVTGAGLIGYVIVSSVLRWHGVPSRVMIASLSGLLTLPANTALGLAAAVLMTTTPWATLLLSSSLLFLIASYHAYSRLSERYASLELLNDFTRLVGGARSPDAVLEAILEHSKALLSAERAVIWLEDGDEFVGLEVGRHGRSEVRVPPKARELLADWFGDSRDATLASGSDHRRNPLMAEILRSRHCVVAPITEAGELVGLIAAIDRIDGVEEFRTSHAKLFTTLAGHASAALENGRLIHRLHDEARTREHEAMHDPLTGLPNRVLFAQRLRDELDAADLGHRTGPAVGLMDLDDFKHINDTLGHHWGDHALVEVARRLTQTAGPKVTVARLSGDEFALLTPGWSAIELDAFANRLRQAVTEPLVLGGKRLSIGISIGLAAYTGTGDDGAVLMRRADAAMYRAKQLSKAGGGTGYALAIAGEGLAEP